MQKGVLVPCALRTVLRRVGSVSSHGVLRAYPISTGRAHLNKLFVASSRTTCLSAVRLAHKLKASYEMNLQGGRPDCRGRCWNWLRLWGSAFWGSAFLRLSFGPSGAVQGFGEHCDWSN